MIQGVPSYLRERYLKAKEVFLERTPHNFCKAQKKEEKNLNPLAVFLIRDLKNPRRHAV